ncbi:MAG TPA: M24 family metallopeptidase, partial [Proteobacteria bacterium]|nr:M24 family metallopeptidase [Pseudomonadota bacterium]
MTFGDGDTDRRYANLRRPNVISIKSPEEIEKMRRAGRVVALVHAELRESVKPGVSTWELDRIARERCEKEGAVPAFLGYRGYPAALCVSIDNEVVHGIPSKDRVLEEGSIVSFDFGAKVDGYY